MAPKKDKGKKEEEKNGAFTEVEKTFLEQQVAECNRKIARLRTALEECETRNEELQNAYEKLDEDRADIIAYLKKLLKLKNEENSELKEKVKGLDEIRDMESTQYHEKVTELEKNFTIMKNQLSSENKLLVGKLNTLEEFRAVRDELMKKFEKQEKDFEDQEMKYKRIIYDTEKKFIIGKEKLKKEMEARLLQLAQDFQDATELRIAATTHRLIRENIAISNELNNILSTQQKISDQNEIYKENIRAAAMAKELAEEERDKAIHKSIVQLKVIDQLTTALENVKKEKALFEKKSYDFETLQTNIQKLTKENDNLTLQVHILEQSLHSKLSEHNKFLMDTSKIEKERDKLRNILQEAAYAIQAALKLDQWAHIDPEQRTLDRQLFLSHLLQIVSQFREIQESESLATIVSFSKIYDEGDLGFVPKSNSKKKVADSSTFSASQQARKEDDPIQSESKTSIASKPISTYSAKSSAKTVASIQVLPKISVQNIPETDASVESFIKSAQSTVSDEQASESDDKSKADIEKQLLASKLEIQKSILKDLAFSQMAFKRSSMASAQTSIVSKPSTSVLMRKSVTIMESVQDVKEAKVSIIDKDSSSCTEQKDLDVEKKHEVCVDPTDLEAEELVPESQEEKFELSSEQQAKDEKTEE